MAREDDDTNARDGFTPQYIIPPRPFSLHLREHGCTGRISSACRCRPAVRGCAMRREPFFWIIAAWWVLFLLCLVWVFGGSAAG